MLFFLLNDIYECLDVKSEDEFFLQKIWASKTQRWPIDMKNKKKKKHTWNIDIFLVNVMKTKKLSLKDACISAGEHSFITALVQLNNLYNNRFFNAYSMGCLSPTLIKGLLKGCEGNYLNSDSNVYLTLQYWCLGLVEHHVQRHHVTQLYLYR